MGVLSTILGSGDIIKTIGETIDAVHTSDEEELKARADAKAKLISAYAPFKVAQRYLALMFAFTYLTVFWLVVGMDLFSHGFVKENLVAIMGEFKIAYIMLLIVGFYFGGGFAEGLTEKVKAKR